MDDNNAKMLAALQNKLGEPENETLVNKPMITGGEECKTIADLKNHLISHLGEIVDNYLNVATGRDTLHSTNHSVRVELWELAKELLVNQGDRILVEADGTPEGILQAVQSGQCSIQDAEKLLKLFHKAKEIELIGQEQDKDSAFPFIQFNVKAPTKEVELVPTLEIPVNDTEEE